MNLHKPLGSQHIQINITYLLLLNEYEKKIYFFVLFHFLQSVLYVDKWRASLGSIVQNVIVNYSLVVSYLKQGHIGANVNY